jgi:hypothetical protein
MNDRISTTSAGTLAALILVLSGADCGAGRGDEPRKQASEESGGHPLSAHVTARADSIVYQALPAPAVFRSQVPEAMQAGLPPDPTPFGDRVQMTGGSIVIEAWDRTEESRPQPPYSDDGAKVEATFTTADGAPWKVIQSSVAGRKADGSAFLFGGLGTDVLVHGNTGRENPLMPKMRAALSMWGPAQVYKDDQLIKSDALLHVMVTSRARTEPDFHYSDYDRTLGPVDEIHLFLNPQNRLPAPGGFLHMMWERANVTTEAIKAGDETGDREVEEQERGEEPEERNERGELEGSEQAEVNEAAPLDWNFDDMAVGKLPEGWKADATNPGGPAATWAVEMDPTAPSMPKLLAVTVSKRSSGGTFNLLWTDRVEFQNGEIEVKVKAGTGREDRGGGPVWRLQDRNNYTSRAGTRWRTTFASTS